MVKYVKTKIEGKKMWFDNPSMVVLVIMLIGFGCGIIKYMYDRG